MLESSISPGLTSARIQGPVSVSRVSFQELVALVETKEMDLGFSILKKSLFSHSLALDSTLLRGSETVRRVLGSALRRT